MEENLETTNPISEKVINQIDPTIRETFSQEQLAAIRTSISQNLPPRKKHSVEVHGTIPLFFKRIYFVFFSGKDVRKQTGKQVPFELRAKTALKDALTVAGSLLFAFLVFGVLLLGYIAPLMYH